MSDLIKTPKILDSKECLALSSKCISQKIKTRKALVGDNITIRRALPNDDRKTIGAWCFLDHFNSTAFAIKNNEILTVFVR